MGMNNVGGVAPGAAVGARPKPDGSTQSDRGEWGYIPPGSVFVPKRWLAFVNVCLVVILVGNAILLVVQAANYFEKKSNTAKAVATALSTAAASAAK